MLSTRIDTNGYRQVSLTDNVGKRSTKRVSSLVCLTFLGPKPPGKEVRHKQDIKLDDRLKELDYGTHKQNGEDMVRNGHSAIGMRNGQCKLNDEEYEDVLRRALAGEDQGVIAADYGIDRSTVSCIKIGRIKPRK